MSIYHGFAAGLDELNNSTSTNESVTTPIGRAYLIDGKPYYGNIHFTPSSEDRFAHESISQALQSNPQYQGGNYMGTAGVNNLHHIACSRSSFALLFDINPLQKLFWDDFLSVIAETPDRIDFANKMRNYGQHLYKKISENFNIAALHENNRQLQISPPGEYDYNTIFGDEGSSPIRHMKYGDFFVKFGTPLDLKTNYTFGGNKNTHWLANPANYEHIHQMAKHNAIGALTLDVCDTAGCEELSTWLTDKRIKIDFMYLSNIGHYLDWSDDLIRECAEDPEKHARDFCDRTISANQWPLAAANLKTLTHAATKIIRFDNHSGKGRFSQFQPSFNIPENQNNLRFPTPDMESGLTP